MVRILDIFRKYVQSFFGSDISYQVVPPTVSKVEFSIYISRVSKLNVLSLCMTYILNLLALSFVETFIM